MVHNYFLFIFSMIPQRSFRSPLSSFLPRQKVLAYFGSSCLEILPCLWCLVALSRLLSFCSVLYEIGALELHAKILYIDLKSFPTSL